MSKLTPEAELSELRTVALALTTERDDLRATVEKLTVGAADELSAAKQAAEIVASTGTTPVAAEKVEAPAATVEQLREQYAAMPAGAERVAFLQKHKAAILFGRLK